MTSPSQPYSYVFQPRYPKIPWPKLEDFEPPSLLHTKYWGRPIQGNEPELQTPSDGQPVDESEIGPGCFALDLDVKSLRISGLWVRQDYIRLYNYCNTHYNNVWSHSKPGRPPPSAPSVVITGQPGIGKSWWIFYAIRRRLGESNPFLWYFHTKWHLFVHDGVFECPGDLANNFFKPDLWAFVDADDSTNNDSLLLTGRERSVFTILTMSPQRARWKLLEKSTSCAILTMNPWSWEEIREAAIIHGLQPDRLKDVREVYEEYGPTPRVCFDCLRIPAGLTCYRRRRDQEISKLSLGFLLEAAYQHDSKLDDFDSIFLVRRENVDNLRKYIIEPITPSIRQLLRIQLMKEEWKLQLQAYQRLSMAVQTRQMAGQVFASMAQLQLQKDVALDLVPMKLQPASGRMNAKWTSQPNNRVVPSSTAPDSDAGDTADTPTSIKFTPKDKVVYDGPTQVNIHCNVFYVPKSWKQVAFDSFILADQVLYIFQFTSASSHEIEEGIMDFFSQPPLHETLEGVPWRLVFVIRPGATIECRELNVDKLKEFGKRVTLFTAEFDPNTHTSPELLKGLSAQKRKLEARVVSPEQDPARPNGRQPSKRRA